MTVWRTKACEMFGYKPGTFSYKQGVVDVADTLRYAPVRPFNVSPSSGGD